MTVTQVLTQLGRTPGADGDAAGGADDATTAGADEAGGATEVATWTGVDDAGGAAGVDATGAMHLVQTVEIEVLVMVEIVVVTCWMGVPWGGVTVLVTGQVVKVV